MHFAAIDHLANVEAVLKKMREGTNAIRAATLGAAVGYGADFGHDLSAAELLCQASDRTAFEVEPEHGADGVCVLGHDDQLFVHGRVAERREN
jgi:hypothetical protein